MEFCYNRNRIFGIETPKIHPMNIGCAFSMIFKSRLNVRSLFLKIADSRKETVSADPDRLIRLPDPACQYHEVSAAGRRGGLKIYMEDQNHETAQ